MKLLKCENAKKSTLAGDDGGRAPATRPLHIRASDTLPRDPADL